MQGIANILAAFKGLDFNQILALGKILASAPPGTVDALISLAEANKVPGIAIVATLWAHKDQIVSDFAAVEKAIQDLIALVSVPATPAA